MFKLRAQLTQTQRLLVGGLAASLLLGAWVLVTALEWIQPATLPGPVALLQAVPEMHYERFLLANSAVSLLRITLGFAIAALLAVPLGILMGSFGPVRAAFTPLVGPLRFLPIAAVVPIFIFWFGLGETMKVALLAIGTFVYLLPLVVESVDQVEEVYLKAAATLGASRFQRIWTILVPASLPAIYEALRVMFGLGWTYVMLAEFVSENSGVLGYGGVGYLINNLRRYGSMSDILVAVGTILLIGVGVDLLLGYIGKTIFPWYSKA